MLARGGIPKTFWPEAVLWSVHLLNRSLTFAVQNMTPEEAWSGRKPGVDYFKIFGCIAYAHIPNEKRKKLDDKSEKCIFLGVSETSKAFKLFNPLTNQIVTSRDVVFDEENIWDWNGQQPTPIILDDEVEKEEKPTEISENNVPRDEESSIISEIQSPTSEAAAAVSAQSCA